MTCTRRQMRSLRNRPLAFSRLRSPMNSSCGWGGLVRLIASERTTNLPPVRSGRSCERAASSVDAQAGIAAMFMGGAHQTRAQGRGGRALESTAFGGAYRPGGLARPVSRSRALRVACGDSPSGCP